MEGDALASVGVGSLSGSRDLAAIGGQGWLSEPLKIVMEFGWATFSSVVDKEERNGMTGS